MNRKSDGESLFGAYLRQRDFAFEYEAEVNGRCPDFLVHSPQVDFAAEIYEPAFKLPAGGGPYCSYDPLRRTFQGRKAKQISAAKRAGLPYLAVLASTNSDIEFEPLLTAGAMFGNLQITIPVRDDFESSHGGYTSFGGGARLQPKLKRGVSAVALLSRINPTQGRLDRVIEQKLSRYPKRIQDMTEREVMEAAEIIARLEDHCLATGVFDPSARVARLEVLHNPYASYPFQLGVFVGQFDRQWARTGAAYGPLGR